ncbi:MAG: VWA domain-containing protein [Terriglobales bacterium]
MNQQSTFRCLMLVIIVLAPATLRVASAQSPIASTAPVQSAADHGATEIESRDEMPSFKVNARLVLVRVVVRDAKGQTVTDLHEEDFQVFDKGQPQTISHFSVEPLLKPDTSSKATGNDEVAGSSGIAAKPAEMPNRFIAYVFDDQHMDFGNLAPVRDAALRHFKTLHPTDRAAIFTTSGKTMLDFGDDPAKLQETLLRLRPAPTADQINPCPDISYFQADLIVNKHDAEATKVAVQEYLTCSQMGPNAAQLAPQVVSSTAQAQLNKGDIASRASLDAMNSLLKRISRMPGERKIILLSPGFLAPQMEQQYTDVIDQAVRSEVVINAIDARGLYALIPGGDASHEGIAIDPDPKDPTALVDPAAEKLQYEQHEAADDANILSSFAYGTGGTFIQNSNDFDEAFRRIAEAAEYSYLLGFVPQHLKTDGSFHVLKVTLRSGKNLSVQARSGYFAPNGTEDATTEAKREIEDEIYSQESLNDLPLTIGTQFFKADNNAAKLIVLSHLDASRLQFEKTGDRHNDEITVASAVFDKNGNFLQGTEKVVTLNLKDENWSKTLQQGITMRAEFELKSGQYIVRVVAREMNGRLSALNAAAEIY